MPKLANININDDIAFVWTGTTGMSFNNLELSSMPWLN